MNSALADLILVMHAAFVVFVGAYALVRWANWELRVPPDSLSLPSWAYPAIYAGTIAVCGAIGWLRWRARPVPGGPGTA